MTINTDDQEVVEIIDNSNTVPKPDKGDLVLSDPTLAVDAEGNIANVPRYPKQEEELVVEHRDPTPNPAIIPHEYVQPSEPVVAEDAEDPFPGKHPVDTQEVS